MDRIYNFSAGPAALPVEALKEAQEHLVDYHGGGLSIMECSHRGPEYVAVHNEALANIRRLLKVPENYTILFLQGGASMQFTMVPFNLMGEGQTADYALTGAWGKKAVAEAKKVGQVHLACDTMGADHATVPSEGALDLTEGAAYLHITTNETISGNQFKRYPEVNVPLVADMSSDILAHPIDVSQFGLIYAGAQKNMGPSGVAMVIIRDDLLERSSDRLPSMLNYKVHAKNDSMFNTPPCFSIYMLSLSTRWLLERGGVEGIALINERKASTLYSAIDATGFYSGTADVSCRSTMNVTFRLPSEALEAAFIQEASARGFSGLKGHRSVGGVRASIYNAFPEAGVDALVSFMQEFEKSHG